EKLAAQNLVPNPSFEDTVYCPYDYNQLNAANFWINARSSVDYFNKCSNSFVSIPNNLSGYQEAFNNGSGYVGLITFTDGMEYREYLTSHLINQLNIGEKYFVSVKVSLSNESICASNNIGIKFSTISFSDTGVNPNPTPIDNHCQIHETNIISDTTSWVLVSGSFVADSEYLYIIIGNFFNDSSTQVVHFTVPPCNSYYYIDDVCVSPDSLECDLNPEGIYNLPQQQFAIYPNPATEQLIIDNARPPVGQGQLTIKGIELFDLVGRKMMDDELLVNNSNHYSLNTKNFPRGYYFIRIHTSEGSINRKIVLQ
ncbi:MAG: T9SS type A sorting domain-containing protein, partial [Bacteroidota bacterium]